MTEQTQNYTFFGSFKLASQPLELVQRIKHKCKCREVLEGETKLECGGLRLAQNNCETAPQVTGHRAGLSMAHIINHRLCWVDSLIFKVRQAYYYSCCNYNTHIHRCVCYTVQVPAPGQAVLSTAPCPQSQFLSTSGLLTNISYSLWSWQHLKVAQLLASLQWEICHQLAFCLSSLREGKGSSYLPIYCLFPALLIFFSSALWKH